MNSKASACILALLVVLSLSSCGKSKEQIAEENRQKELAAQMEAERLEAEEAQRVAQEEAKREAEATARLRAYVRQNLKDPESAKFGELVVLSPTEACFPVNAKNSFGGYTGETFLFLKRLSEDDDWKIDRTLGTEFADSLCRTKILVERYEQDR